jgi:uncharacterized protein YbaR (Trm112 family)
VSLDKEFLDILRCPNDLGELELLEAEEKLVCKACGYRYRIMDGDIPVMLVDEAEKPA